MATIWYQTPIKQVLKNLESSEQGLSNIEAKKRLDKYGLNEIIEVGKVQWYTILLRQFVNIMIIILIFGMVVSFAVGEKLDSVAIGIIIIINAIIGFVQEYKAEKAIDALKKMTASHSLVIRDGETKKIPANELVPGDILVLEEGMSIAADARLISEAELRVNESSLTGESLPVEKDTGVIQMGKSVGDMINMLFKGTIVVHGRGMAIVVATGMETEFGKIARAVQTEKPGPTPLQKKLNHLSKVLAIIIVVISLILFIGSLFTGRDPIEMLILSISLAVSVIPEGLPAVITLTLALSVQQMAKKNAIVRRLSAAETLGSTSVICTDKTGTLTQNQMTVTNIFANGKEIKITGRGYRPEGDFMLDGTKTYPLKMNPVKKLLEIAVLCNNAKLIHENSTWNIIGDPTEGCLMTVANKAGIDVEKMQKKSKRLHEFVFDSERKRMSTINHIQETNFLLSKGAPDSILEICSHILIGDKIEKLTAKKKREIMDINDKFAKSALRVLGFAYKEIGKKFDTENIKEDKMIFAGLMGMIDPPRDEVKFAIQRCIDANISVIMITGDHALTAKAVGEEIGLFRKGDKIIDGATLEKMSQKELNKSVQSVRIFARVNPEHKVKILKALKYHGHIVAMTGDGVNDAPALRNADIGVAMGISGTDVAKESGEMILTDDNFATIVDSIESGRTIYRNIKKFIRFLLSANFDEVLLISVVFSLGLPLPILPLQILWVNLLTDALPAIALGLDAPEENIMKLKPRNPKTNVLKELMGFSIFAGLISASISFVIYFDALSHYSIEYTRSMVLTTIVLFELLLVYSSRFENRHYFTHFFKNKLLIFSVIISLIAQIAVIYTPALQKIFKTDALRWQDWAMITFACIGGIVLIEIWKQFRTQSDHV